VGSVVVGADASEGIVVENLLPMAPALALIGPMVLPWEKQKRYL